MQLYFIWNDKEKIITSLESIYNSNDIIMYIEGNTANHQFSTSQTTWQERTERVNP